MSPVPRLTDKEFLELWDQHRSPAVIAQLTGLSQRHIHTKRRAIEGKLKIQLAATGTQAHIQKSRHKAGLTDGIALVFSDAHFWPGIRTTAFKGLLWAIQELKPHVIINNGDAFDGSAISRHPRIVGRTFQMLSRNLTPANRR